MVLDQDVHATAARLSDRSVWDRNVVTVTDDSTINSAVIVIDDSCHFHGVVVVDIHIDFHNEVTTSSFSIRFERD